MKHIIWAVMAAWIGVATAETRFNPLNVKRVEGVVGVTHDELRAAIREEDTALRADLVPKTTKVNNHALSGDITLTPADVQALPLAGGTMDDEAEVTFRSEEDSEHNRTLLVLNPLTLSFYDWQNGDRTILSEYGANIMLWGGYLWMGDTSGGPSTFYQNGSISRGSGGSVTATFQLPSQSGTLALTSDCNGSITVKKKTVNNQNEISGESSTVYTPSTAKILTSDELGALNAVTGGVVNGLFPRFTHINPALSVGWSTFHDMQTYDPLEPTTAQPVMFSAGASIHTKAQNTITLGWGVNNTNNYSFIWSGDADRYYSPTAYADSSYGTRFNGGFHINPKVRSGMTTPLENFWVGDQHLKAWIEQLAPSSAASIQCTYKGLETTVQLALNSMMYGHPSSQAEKDWDGLLYDRIFDWRVDEDYDVGFNFVLVDDVIFKHLYDADGKPESLTNVVTQLKNESAHFSEKVQAVVTTEYIQNKLQVYLYIGDDGGIYVHTPTTNQQ